MKRGRSSEKVAARVLVCIVEDEPLLLIAAADFLSDAGFDTLEASNADQAIALLQQRDDIAVVVTDFDMPGSMDGLKLALAIRERWPPVEIIVVSAEIALTPEQLPVRGRFLAKPYDPDHLVGMIRAFAATA
ncbi:hypothetical protein CWS35_26715 [Bradyrhizobium sp. SK17]|nr:hypothetical protein CWS35_26715 [Bradyrhizobium sp. SK17]